MDSRLFIMAKEIMSMCIRLLLELIHSICNVKVLCFGINNS